MTTKTESYEKLTNYNDTLFGPQVWKTILKIAQKTGNEVPREFPHYTFPDGSNTTEYKYFPSSVWTSGFFPGSLWALYERIIKYPTQGSGEGTITKDELLKLARLWEEGMKPEQFNTKTHDIGFMIMPSYGRDHQLNGTEESKEVIIQAAESLTTRFSPITKCIRSWDIQRQANREFTNPDKDFLVIVDNLMNLDLLYYASQITGDAKYSDIATTHAKTTLINQFRSDNSSYHLVVYDTQTGDVKGKYTHQGYSDESTWSRGQAWALYGYASCYKFTKDKQFLNAAKKFTDYFLSRLPEDRAVYWDFDAPRPCYWDVSAAMIATSGMLLIQSLDPSANYLPEVIKIINRVTKDAWAGTPEWGTILKHSTVQNHGQAYPGTRVADIGLVYADYYFIETANRLLDMGVV